MAAVYKSLTKTNGHAKEVASNGARKNKQKVLILSSRGVTYRYDIGYFPSNSMSGSLFAGTDIF